MAWEGLQGLLILGRFGEFLLIQKVEVLRVIYCDDCLLVLRCSEPTARETIALELSSIVYCVHLDDADAIDLGDVVFDFYFRLIRIRSKVHHTLCCQVVAMRHHL